MKILYTVDEDGLLFVNPYDSEKKGPYLPVCFLTDRQKYELDRIIQEVKNENVIN